MQCYRLFDWQRRQSNGVEMFLRKNEYNQLSIYHYMLEKKRMNNILQEIETTNKLPTEIKTLLANARNLDALFINTLNATLQRLTHWEASLPAVPLKYVKAYARKLGVPVYEGTHKNTHVPFAIHPLLPIRALYAEELEESGGKFSLSKKIWKNVALKRRLADRNYHVDHYFSYWDNTPGFDEKFSRHHREIIGTIHELITTDGLLLHICTQYDPDFNRVENMHDQDLVIHKKNKEADSKAVVVTASYRQLGKIYFFNRDSDLSNILLYMRRKAWTNSQHPYGPDARDQGPHHTVPFTAILQERDRIYQSSLWFIQALLAWEKKVIESDPAAASSVAQKAGMSVYLDFTDILSLADITDDTELKSIRNKAFHSSIPKDWTYDEKASNAHIKEFISEIVEGRKARREKYEA
jgi:hypothetical protein